ncbi:hypothetical protein GOODEAATRI_018899, partial [Goodea atripinnis]
GFDQEELSTGQTVSPMMKALWQYQLKRTLGLGFSDAAIHMEGKWAKLRKCTRGGRFVRENIENAEDGVGTLG